MDEQQPQPYDDIAAAGAPASPDALRSIVARHQRARTRTLGILLAVALVAGPIAGWAIGNGGGGGQKVATGSSPNAPTAGAPNALNAPVAGGVSTQAFGYGANPPKATHLFTRTTSDGITIRAYRMDPPQPPPEANATTPTTTATKQQTICPKPMVAPPGAGSSGSASGSSGSATATASASSGEAGTSTGGGEPAPAPEPEPGAPPAPPPNGAPPPCAPGVPPVCKAAPSVLAEVSNDAAVGQSFDPIDDKQPSDALSHLVVSGFGLPESSPATFVTVQAGAGVATVRLRLPSGATDTMAPQGGVAVLALGGSQPPPDGTVVEALDAGGKVVQSMPLAQPGPRSVVACAFAVGSATARPLPVPPTTR